MTNNFIKTDKIYTWASYFRAKIIISSIIMLSVLMVVFQSAFDALMFNGNPSLLNQIGLLLIVGSAVYLQTNERSVNKYFLIVLSLIIYMIFISFMRGKNSDLGEVILQSLLHTQFFLVIISLYIIQKVFPDILLKIFKIVIVITIIGVGIQVIFPQLFINLITPSEQVLLELSKGDLRYWGFQGNPNRLGILVSLYICLYFFNKNLIITSNTDKILLFVSGLVVVLSGSRTALLFLLIAFYLSDYSISKKFSITILMVVTLSAFGLLQYISDKTGQNLINIFVSSPDDTRYIRWLMAYHGTGLALEYFPFGTGAATFGSTLSVGSSVYAEVGIANLPSVYNAKGIYDSNYGTIMGEFGFIGLMLFYGVGYYLLKKSIILKASINNVNMKRVFYFICTVSLISTFMRPLFASAYYSVLISFVVFNTQSINTPTYKFRITKN